MKLIDLFFKNSHLNFVDAISKANYSLQDLIIQWPVYENEGKKKLVFLYLDGSIRSLSTYLSMLITSHTIALLDNGLDISLKDVLENEYCPDYIFDETRFSISITTDPFLEILNPKLGAYIFKSRSNRGCNTIHENCRLLLSTSGSTGSPKFVKLSEQNAVDNALSIVDYLPIVSNDVTPLNLPLYYSYGLSILHTNAIAGGTIVCGLNDILQRDFWNAAEIYGFTSIAGVPFIYEMLDRIGFRKKMYPSLCYMTQAGGNLNLKTKEKFVQYCKENTIELFVMYGQTEATARISYVPHAWLESKMGSIGIPIKDGKLSLDPETQELLYQGPNVYGGYAQNINDLATWDYGTILKTGDIGKIDEDGFYYILGRTKRFVKLFGNRINLDEIELHIKNSIDFTAIACIGLEDKFLLITHCWPELEEAPLKKNLFDTFKIHAGCLKFQYVESLPLTGNGKIHYQKIKEFYEL